jgi:hypothetical protein
MSSHITPQDVVKLRQLKALVELLFTKGALALYDPVVMAGAWRGATVSRREHTALGSDS